MPTHCTRFSPSCEPVFLLLVERLSLSSDARFSRRRSAARPQPIGRSPPLPPTPDPPIAPILITMSFVARSATRIAQATKQTTVSMTTTRAEANATELTTDDRRPERNRSEPRRRQPDDDTTGERRHAREHETTHVHYGDERCRPCALVIIRTISSTSRGVLLARRGPRG